MADNLEDQKDEEPKIPGTYPIPHSLEKSVVPNTNPAPTSEKANLIKSGKKLKNIEITPKIRTHIKSK